MTGIEVPPLSLKDIRNKVKSLRKLLYKIGFLENEDEPYIDIVRLYEYFLQQIGVEFIVLPINELGSKHGETLIGTNIIRIREDVYNRACEGYGRDRFTMAHELAHLLLHRLENLSLAREIDGVEIPAYKNPEWQANAFAGELLAPFHLIKNKNINDIAKIHGITVMAAKVQKRER